MKYILYHDEGERGFVMEDGSYGYHWSVGPWHAVKFNSPEEARNWAALHFPGDSFAVLGFDSNW